MSNVSEVLDELAGAASLCWEPKPTGVFDATKAGKFVDEAEAKLHRSRRRDAGGVTMRWLTDAAFFVWLVVLKLAAKLKEWWQS